MSVGGKQSIKYLFAAILFSSAFFMSAHLVSAAESDITGIEYAAQSGLGDEDPRIVVARAIRIALGFLGIVALALVIYAGFLWMTSEGNEEKIEQAKMILKNAIIGIIIIFSAFGIVSFILQSLLNSYGNNGNGGNGGSNGYTGGIGALGNGIIKSVYPEPNQKDVPRNTSIIVTFREKIRAGDICQTTADLCNGENIIKENIRIFQTSQGNACKDDKGDITGCDTNVTDVRAYTKDGLTFIFSPASYLGSPSEIIWYSVNLSKYIRKADGKEAFKSFDNGYEWRFEVSNKLDLKPPQVLQGGIFPAPDNEKDLVGTSTEAVASSGRIIASGTPSVHVTRGVGAPNPDTVEIQGTYSCNSDGTIRASVDASGKILVSGAEGFVGGDETGDGKAEIGCGLTLSGTFSAGNSWTFTVTSEKQADNLIVGNTAYTFVSSGAVGNQINRGANNNTTALNIKNALSANNAITATVSDNIVTLIANIAGESGNKINLSSSNPDAISIVPMSGGKDRTQTTAKKDRADKARNAVIRIDFNEAVNPLRLSGTSDDLKNYIRVINLSSSAMVAGKFVVSNQYQTVEFISNEKCGVNACGEPVYCLPENSNLKVELMAAHLTDCGSDICASKSPFNFCADWGDGKTCQDIASSTNPINYPLAAFSLDGITDLSGNSLDGNRNGNAEGPISYYNENSPNIADGDNYKWSFFINDKIDLGAPVINTTNLANNATGVLLNSTVSLNFSKLMMSSSIATGEIVINGITHKLINLRNFINQPMGYWATNVGIDEAPQDGEPDKTQAKIGHTDFSDVTKYRAQVGSGVKDIYQNCFKPCAGPACTGANACTDGSPSCCSGTVRAGESCQ